MTWKLKPGRSKLTPADEAEFRARMIEACLSCIAAGVYPNQRELYARGIRAGNHRVLSTRDELIRCGDIPDVPKPRHGVARATGPVDEATMTNQARRAIGEIILKGGYPSLPALRRHGVHGQSDRIIAVRDAVMEGMDVPRRVNRPAAHRKLGHGAAPTRPVVAPTGLEAQCRESSQKFWGTVIGKRTRELLRRPTCQSCI
jgi:hypothetical protein